MLFNNLRIPNACTISFLLTCCFLNGCKQDRPSGDGIAVQTTIPFSLYMKTGVGLRSGGGQRFTFPYAEVYDQTGTLVYSGHDLNAAYSKLGVLAQKEGPPPNASGATLSQTLIEIPGLAVTKTKILQRHRVSVISLSLDGCESCSLQDSSLTELQHSLITRGVNVFMVHVLRRP